jgi:hypothetical protein
MKAEVAVFFREMKFELVKYFKGELAYFLTDLIKLLTLSCTYKVLI